jgi:hypothetical protein
MYALSLGNTLQGYEASCQGCQFFVLNEFPTISK